MATPPLLRHASYHSRLSNDRYLPGAKLAIDLRGDLEEIERLKAELRQAKPAVRRLRKELGLSQAEVAEILETTQSNVSKIEAKADPPLAVLRRLIESRGGRLHMTAVFGDGREIPLAS